MGFSFSSRPLSQSSAGGAVGSRLREAGRQHLFHQRDQFAEGGVALSLSEALVAEPLSDEVDDDGGAGERGCRATFD